MFENGQCLRMANVIVGSGQHSVGECEMWRLRVGNVMFESGKCYVGEWEM